MSAEDHSVRDGVMSLPATSRRRQWHQSNVCGPLIFFNDQQPLLSREDSDRLIWDMADTDSRFHQRDLVLNTLAL